MWPLRAGLWAALALAGPAWAFVGDAGAPPPAEEAPEETPLAAVTGGVRLDWLGAAAEGRALLRSHTRRGRLQGRLDVAWQPLTVAAYDPGRGRLVAGAGRDVAPLRMSLTAPGWLLGDFQPGLGPVLRLTGETRPRPAGAWRLQPLDGRLLPPPALRGLAWMPGSWVLILSLRPLDLYQYRFRYRPDPWQEDALPPCERPGQEAMGYRCDAAGQWVSQSLVDPAGRALRGVTLAQAAVERLAALAWRDEDGGVAFYGARLDWRLAAPGLALDPGEGYPVSRRPWALGAWRRGRWAGLRWRAAWTRAGAGDALQGALRRGRWGLAAWWYAAAYENPYAGGPVARPWLARRDQRALRLAWTGAAGGWTGTVWRAGPGPARWRLDGARRRGGVGLALAAEATGDDTAPWRLETGLTGALGRAPWRLRAGGHLTRQWGSAGAGRRLRLFGRVERRLGGGRLRLSATAYARDGLGRRWLSAGDGDRLSLQWLGRRSRLGVWAAADGRAALWLGWQAQNRSKP